MIGKIWLKNSVGWIFLVVSLSFLVFIWTRSGLDNIPIDTDLGRDLSELSNIWQRKVVWLGPRLSPGLHASSTYYYLLFPFLKLGAGNVRSIFIATVCLATVILGWFGFNLIKQVGRKGIAGILFVGLSPWWSSIAFHPGNGFTYALWSFAACISLWFGRSLFISALLVGLSIAYHPAGVFLLPVLFYEWWRKGHRIKNLLFLFTGVAGASLPLIIFEIITKGFILRSFLANPVSVMHFSINGTNMASIAHFSPFGIIGWWTVWITVGFLTTKRLRIWYWISTAELLFFVCVSKLSVLYLLGFVSLIWFIVVMAFLQKRIAGAVCLVLGCAGLLTMHLSGKSSAPQRPLHQLEANTAIAAKSPFLAKTNKVAVVSALSPATEVPQADDYRFFLRIKGYNVLDVQQYSQADTLVMFIEQSDFDWYSWNNWELEQVGARKKVDEMKNAGTKVIIWKKE